MKHIPFSGVRCIFEKALRLEQSGKPVVHLEIGRPHFDTPAHIKAAACAAMENGKVHYTSNYGILPLRQSIARKLAWDNDLHYSAEDEIIVTNGVSEGVMMSMMGLLNPGDEVMLLEPVFLAYEAAIRLAGAVPVSVPIADDETYQPTIADLETKLTARTRMLVFCNPCNPTGVVLNRESLACIAQFAIQNDLLVVADEIYEKILYHGQSVTSIASLPGMRARTITLNGFSKTYAMTGWRVGYLVADASIIQALIRVHQFSVVCTTSFAQWGALAALESSQVCVSDMVAQYNQRREVTESGLQQIPTIDFVQPAGAFYVYIDTRSFDRDAFEFAEELLESYQVAVVPWDHSHVRISFATEIEALRTAMNRFCEAVASAPLNLSVS